MHSLTIELFHCVLMLTSSVVKSASYAPSNIIWISVSRLWQSLTDTSEINLIQSLLQLDDDIFLTIVCFKYD